MNNKFDTDSPWEWEQLPTHELESMLQIELKKEIPNDDIVLLILHILEKREQDEPIRLTESEQTAFGRYKQKILNRQKKSYVFQRWISIAASVALIIGLMFSIVPQQAEAETFWEMLRRLSSSVIEFFSSEDIFYNDQYVFETDIPGLQQVYDAVLELGVTEPVVPMWLPDGCEFIELNSTFTPMTKSVSASFLYNGGEIIYQLDVYEVEIAHRYYRDESFFEAYEQNGIIFNISKNMDRWTVVWTKDRIEGHITLDCQEDILRKILNSIYVMEE